MNLVSFSTGHPRYFKILDFYEDGPLWPILRKLDRNYALGSFRRLEATGWSQPCLARGWLWVFSWPFRFQLSASSARAVSLVPQLGLGPGESGVIGKAIMWFYSIFKHEEGFKVEFHHLEEK